MEMKICPACGESVPPSAVMCWACYSALDSKVASQSHSQMDEWIEWPAELALYKPCPQCGTKCPHDCHTCWNCYADITSVLPSYDWTLAFRTPAFVMVSALFLLNTWLPQRLRRAALLSGVGLVGGLILEWGFLREKRARTQAELYAKQFNTNPIAGIAQSLFRTAILDGATGLRLDKNEEFLDVWQQINHSWKLQTRLPLYIWGDLRAFLKNCTNGPGVDECPAGQFECCVDEKKFVVHLKNHALSPQESITLEFLQDAPIL